MEKRVKLFDDESAFQLQMNINKWLSEREGKLHDIKFSVAYYDTIATFSALLIYTEERE